MSLWARLKGGDDRQRRLKEISKRLANPRRRSLDLDEIMADNSGGAKDDVMRLCQADPSLRQVMHRYDATRATLDELFDRLQAAGAEQWARGQYVPASALANPETLEFLL